MPSHYMQPRMLVVQRMPAPVDQGLGIGLTSQTDGFRDATSQMQMSTCHLQQGTHVIRPLPASVGQAPGPYPQRTGQTQQQLPFETVRTMQTQMYACHLQPGARVIRPLPASIGPASGQHPQRTGQTQQQWPFETVRTTQMKVLQPEAVTSLPAPVKQAAGLQQQKPLASQLHTKLDMAVASKPNGVFSRCSTDNVCLAPLQVDSNVYYQITLWLGANELCQLDAACKEINAWNEETWHTLGEHTFQGLQIGAQGLSWLPTPKRSQLPKGSLRYKTLWDLAHSFISDQVGRSGRREKFGRNIVWADESSVAYLDFIVDAESLKDSSSGLYLEFDVLHNAENVSLAVEYVAGSPGDTDPVASMTFAPDNGCVLVEKAETSSSSLEGRYLHVLPGIPETDRFHGLMGLILCRDHIAYFRAVRDLDSGLLKPKEHTGLIPLPPHCHKPQKLKPCLAFRDAGPYQIKIVEVCRLPPTTMLPNSKSTNWKPFSPDEASLQ